MPVRGVTRTGRFPMELVSILIPTYHRNELLREAIESALAQTYDPVEVIVIDDSGEAHAEPVAAAYEDVTYVPLEENVGANPARDVGLEAASGRYVQFLDDDDRLRPEKLTRQVPLLDESTGVVYSGVEYSETGRVERPDPSVRGDVLETALAFDLWPPCYTATMLVDRRLLEPLRPFEHHGAGDTELLIGLAERTRFAFVDDPLVEKRINPERSVGSSPENVAHKRQIVAAYEGLFDRYPESRKAAVSRTYRDEGRVRLARKQWDPAAVTAFVRAGYHAPSLTTTGKCIAEALGSVLGRPGLSVATTAGERGRDAMSGGLGRTLGRAVRRFGG